MATATSTTLLDGDETLCFGLYGSLSKLRLVEEPTLLRPGEATTIFNRVLTDIPMGAQTDPLCAIHRFKIWWCRPVFQHPVPPETLLLLEHVQGENNKGNSSGMYRLVLPVVLPLEGGNSFASSSVRGRFVTQGESDDNSREELVLCSNHNETGIYIGHGEDPFALIEEGVMMATQLWNDPGNPQTTTSRPTNTPSFCVRNNVILEKLGWCTWNAFYTDIEGFKVVEAVRALKEEQNIPVRWIILDDGWQHITTQDSSTDSTDCLDGFQWSQRLQSYREDPAKFSSLSLLQTVQQLKEDLGMEAIWVWHTLAGYWLGLNPDSESFENTTTIYYPHFPPGIIDSDSSASKETSVEKGIGIPDDADDFFRQYHRDYLSCTCQVDGIKVDAQGVVGILRKNKPNETTKERYEDVEMESTHPIFRLHNALGRSTLAQFTNEGQQTIEKQDDDSTRKRQSPSIIHCMAHAPEIFYRLPALYQEAVPSSHGTTTPKLPFYRAADDFYPTNHHSHGPQIVACAYNSLLLHHVAIPDWDMFATGVGMPRKILQCHAVARCISGGPIYFSSSPNEIETEAAGNRPQWIDWICCPDGTTLSCRGSALPLLSCLLQDPLAPNAEPLVLWNTNGDWPDAKEKEEGAVTSGVFALFNLAGCGTWDYSMLDYVSNAKTEGEGIFGVVQASASPSVVELCPNMMPAFAEKIYDNVKFLAISFFSQSVQVLPNSETVMRTPLQKPCQSESLAVYPMLQLQGGIRADASVSSLEVALLGWEGRINGAGGIKRIQRSSGSTITISLVGCGCFVAVFKNDEGLEISALRSDLISVHVDDVLAQHSLYRTLADLSEGDRELPTATLRKNLLEQGFVLVLVDVPSETSSHEMTLEFAS